MAAAMVPSSRERMKTSKSWEQKHLDKPNKILTCKLCKGDFTWHGSTSTMNEHLKRKHPFTVEHDEDSPRHKKKTGAMDSYVQQRSVLTPQQQNDLTKSVLNMIVGDMRPINIVDGEWFQKMIMAFNPSYSLPSRTHF